MKIQNYKQNVFTARTIKEVRRIIFSNEKLSVKSIALKLYILGFIFFSNCFLVTLKLLLFKKNKTKVIKSIVVYTVGIVGDNIVLLPSIAAIRKKYPDAKLTIITNCQEWSIKGATSVFEYFKHKDRFIALDDHPVVRRGLKLWINQKKFTTVKCDLFVNFSPFGNRGWFGAVVREMLFAKKLGAKYVIGFHMATFSKHNIFNKVQYHFVKNEPRRAGNIIKALGLSPVEDNDVLPNSMYSKKKILQKIIDQGGNPDNLFVINPGAKFRSKCWPVEYFGQIATWVTKEYNASVVITGIKEEQDIADKVIKFSSSNIINMAGKTTLQELFELIRISKCCVTNDTGTMHISAIAGIPTIALFSLRQSPTHWMPKGKNVSALFNLVDCRYCYNDFCKTIECLQYISIDDIKKAIKIAFIDKAKIKTC